MADDGGDEWPRSGRDSFKEGLHRFLEGGASLGGMTRRDLESLVSDFLGKEGKSRERFDDLIEEFRARSRQGVDRAGDLIRSELRREFGNFTPSRRDEIGEFLERLVGLVGEYFGPGRHREHHERPVEASINSPQPEPTAAAPTVQGTTAKKAAKKAAAKRAPAKKASPPPDAS